MTAAADIDLRKRVADVVAIIGWDKANVDEIKQAIRRVVDPPSDPLRGLFWPLNKRHDAFGRLTRALITK